MPKSDVDDRLQHWAAGTATADCDQHCRLASALSGWERSWAPIEDASSRVCWGCDQLPWSQERNYVRRVWNAVHEEQLPIREVSDRCNLWSVPCPRGAQVHDRGTRCLAGHFAYAILCFFRWMGEGNEVYATLNLESAMDLAWLVQNSSCKDLWGFTPSELALNYERMLTSIWHLHEDPPTHWLSSPGSPQCGRTRPKEPQEIRRAEDGIQRPHIAPTIMCMVLVVWPAEKGRMSTIVETYAPLCQKLIFLTASPSPQNFHGYPVIDLHELFGMRPDPQHTAPDHRPPGEAVSNQGNYNTIEKTLNAFAWAAAYQDSTSKLHDPQDVICRLDSDTLFFPPNLQRIVSCRNFSVDIPWSIGHENYVHKHQEPGEVFLSGGNGICLSKAAVNIFGKMLKNGEISSSPLPGYWNSGRCISVPGHWDDVVFGVCLAKFGIPVSRWGTDCAGRMFFWPLQLETALQGPLAIRPEKVPTQVSWFYGLDEESLWRNHSNFDSYNLWRYRSWQHFACAPATWISDFPVSLHPYRNDVVAKMVFELVTKGKSVNGYFPRLWNGREDQCFGLTC